MLLAYLALAKVPSWWSGQEARSFHDRRSSAAVGLAHSVAAGAQSTRLAQQFSTGSSRFDGEWQFGTHMMSAMGFGQLAHGAPEQRAWAVEQMSMALQRMTSPDASNFDTAAWGEAALDTLPGESGHAAYLGYFNLALSLHRTLDRNSSFGELNSEISEALSRRLADSKVFVLETYPGEIYPVDNMAAVASVALHDRALGRRQRDVVTRWLRHAQSHYLGQDRLLFQSLSADGVTPKDAERGSGTALAAYFASFMSPELSAQLHQAVRGRLYDPVVGFGVVREYPEGHSGTGDIDSGPLVLGYSISATGFAMGAARANGAQDMFDALLRTFILFGAPLERDGRYSFVSGGPLGNAIVFAMVTALPASHWSQL